MDTNAYTRDRPLHEQFLGIQVTRRCDVACRHCMWSCGPSCREEIDWDVTHAFLTAAVKQGMYRKLEFTGGEPFLVADKIRDLVQSLDQYGINTGVTTCSHWAATLDDAIRALKEFPGLQFLRVSADPFHLEQIPVERVRNVLQAAHMVNVPRTMVTVVTLGSDAETLEMKELFSDIPGKMVLGTSLLNGGRARTLLSGELEPVYGPADGRCDAASPMMMVDGSIVACCGPLAQAADPLLLLGHARTDSPTDVNRRFAEDPFLRALRSLGPRAVAQLVIDHGGEDVLSGKQFVDRATCSVCTELLTSVAARDAAVELVQSPAVLRRISVIEFFDHKGPDALLQQA